MRLKEGIPPARWDLWGLAHADPRITALWGGPAQCSSVSCFWAAVQPADICAANQELEPFPKQSQTTSRCPQLSWAGSLLNTHLCPCSFHPHPYYHTFSILLLVLPDRLRAGSCLETDDVLSRDGKVYEVGVESSGRLGSQLGSQRQDHKAFRHSGYRADYQHLSSLNINTKAA